MKRISLIGIIVGGVVDLVSTWALGIALMLFVMVKFNLLKMPRFQLLLTLLAMDHAHPWFRIRAMAHRIGRLCSSRVRSRMDRQAR